MFLIQPLFHLLIQFLILLILQWLSILSVVNFLWKQKLRCSCQFVLAYISQNLDTNAVFI